MQYFLHDAPLILQEMIKERKISKELHDPYSIVATVLPPQIKDLIIVLNISAETAQLGWKNDADGQVGKH